ncbi:MAG: hypothetical protein A3C53_03895 [Omnitrophica WOR_2 bacterium RIFCSPHIGHO2_02_FULL_68_15]|nr:MAG: hypothetical protein A3C53_03895 [Omnitrophica WOR_2 bacterium RIFCSPHIGHO2_02_FULL_68_15]
MNCATSQKQLSLYVDQRLAPQDREALDAHLVGCGSCREALQSLQQMMTALRAMERPEPPALLPGIHRALEHAPWWETLAQRFLAPWPASLPWRGLALATTAALIGLVVLVPTYGIKRSVRLASLKDGGAPAFQAPSTSSVKLSQTTPFAQASAKASSRLLRAKDFAEAERQSTPTEHLEMVTSLPEVKKRNETVDDTRRVADEPKAALRSQTFQSSAPSSASYLDGAQGRQGGKDDAFSDAPIGAIARDAETPRDGKSETPSREEVQRQSGPALVQMKWAVAQPLAAAAEVIAWVGARQGFAVSTDEHHLFITLPVAELPQFLKQFPGDVLGGPDAAPPAGPLSEPARWVVISLQLVPTP